MRVSLLVYDLVLASKSRMTMLGSLGQSIGVRLVSNVCIGRDRHLHESETWTSNAKNAMNRRTVITRVIYHCFHETSSNDFHHANCRDARKDGEDVDDESGGSEDDGGDGGSIEEVEEGEGMS